MRTIISIILYIIGSLGFLGGISTFQQRVENSETPEQKRKKASGMLAFGLVMAFIGWVVWPESKPEVLPITVKQSDTTELAPEIHPIEEQRGEAYLMSQIFLKKILKAPATANFPAMSESEVLYKGDSIFTIKSYVDAQNSYGANLRNDYTAKLKLLPRDQWLCLKIKLLDNQ